MGIARYLSKLASVLNTDGVVPASKGGTGVTSPGASGNLLVSNGTGWVSAAGLAGPTGPTGPQGTNGTIGVNGATGPTGPGGLGFTIAKTYASVAALTADTAPTGITAGQFAIIDTGDTNNAENSRLYIWTGSTYTYTSDLSGAQGIVGPTGPQGTNGTIGVDGATGPTGPAGSAGAASTVAGPTGPTGAQGPAGTAATGGASFYTGDIVLSANTTQYTAPTWLPCDGALYNPGTYPGLDTLYQTAGDYATTPGIFTEPRYTDGSVVTYGSLVMGQSSGVFDPITGDMFSYNQFNAAGSRVLFIQRASDGRLVYNTSSSLATNVQSDYGSGSGYVYYAISPNGQLLVVYRGSGTPLITVYKRNSLATETSTGVRWIAAASTATVLVNAAMYNMKINNNGLIIYPSGTPSAFVYQIYDVASNTLTAQVSFNSISCNNGQYGGGLDFWSGLANYMFIATGTSSYQSGMYAWNGSGISLVSGLPTANTYNVAVINNAGTAVYVTRSSLVDIYSITAGSGALTLNSSISVGYSVQAITFSAGDAFMALAHNNGISMYQRSSAGAVTYTATGYVPEAYNSQGIVNGTWRLQFDPVYNALVGFGVNTTTGTYLIRNWKGVAKTIVPITTNPGNKLKYYIKTGS
jgi:hypothetical protein